MGGKYGVEETLKIVGFLGEFGNVIEQVVEKESDVADKLAAAGTIIDEVMDLLTLDFSELKLEFKEYDLEDRKKITAYFKNKFSLDNDQLNWFVETAFEIIVKQHAIYEDIKTLIKRKEEYEFKALKNVVKPEAEEEEEDLEIDAP